MSENSKSRKLTRRETLKRLGLGSGGPLIGVSAASAPRPPVATAAPAKVEPSKSAFDWQRFKGQSIYRKSRF